MKLLTSIKDTVQGKAPSLTHKRSNHWATVRKNFLETNTQCAVCNGKESLEVHHKQPFHVNPDLELDPTNLIVLCESKSHGINCHLLVGHLGNYKNINPDVVADAATWNQKLQQKNC